MTKMRDFVSKVEVLGYCSGFTTNSQEITCLVSVYTLASVVGNYQVCDVLCFIRLECLS